MNQIIALVNQGEEGNKEGKLRETYAETNGRRREGRGRR